VRLSAVARFGLYLIMVSLVSTARETSCLSSSVCKERCYDGHCPKQREVECVNLTSSLKGRNPKRGCMYVLESAQTRGKTGQVRL
jgi:hypothetical protein